MQHWEFVEAILPPYRTVAQRKQLAREIHKISFIVLSVAFGMIPLANEIYLANR